MSFSEDYRQLNRVGKTHYRFILSTIGAVLAVMACGTGSNPGGNNPGGSGPDTTKPGTWSELSTFPKPPNTQNPQFAGSGVNLAVSSDSKIIFAGVVGGRLYSSPDQGKNWVERSPATGSGSGNLYWNGLASSADGGNLAAVVSSGHIYTSVNSGSSWKDVSPATGDASGNLNWAGIASSSDGVNLVAIDGLFPSVGHIYTSIDSGGHWIDRTPSSGNASGNLTWSAVANSSDGKRIIAGTAANGGSGFRNPAQLFISTDSGAHWKDVSPNDNLVTNGGWWKSVASSSDGKYLVATASWETSTEKGVKIFTSDNFGDNFIERTIAKLSESAIKTSFGQGAFITTASSADGSRVVVAVTAGYTSYVFTSSDYGTNWTLQPSPSLPDEIKFSFLIRVTSSSDGRILHFVQQNYTKANYGSATYLSGPPDEFRLISLTFP